MIKRRHVIYVEGYDPQGAEGYHNLFLRSWRRFMKLWPLEGSVGDLVIDSEDVAHWDIAVSGPNWQVATRYDFIRQEQFIRANMAEPMWRQLPRAIGWAADYLFSGALIRIFRAAPRYGVVLVFFQLMLVLWLSLSIAGGALADQVAAALLGWPRAASVVIGVAVAVAIFQMLRPLANRLFLIQINNHWPFICEWARGVPNCFERTVETGARHLIETARANTAEEIVLIGHSGGGALAPAILARALELDPDVGRHGPRLILFTPGSLMPAAALHPRAKRLRAAIARIAVEPSVCWIDVQARKDVMNFWNFDPVAGIGVEAGERRCNPLVWKVRMRDMVQPDFYRRLRWNFFRMHYQFIMANDIRAPYDYFMLVCGPVGVEEWARFGSEIVLEFAADAAYTPQRAAA